MSGVALSHLEVGVGVDDDGVELLQACGYDPWFGGHQKVSRHLESGSQGIGELVVGLFAKAVSSGVEGLQSCSSKKDEVRKASFPAIR